MLGANLASGAAVLVAIRVWRPKHALPWLLIGAGLLIYGIGNGV